MLLFDALKLLWTDPTFQIPLWGSLSACVCCALMGSVIFVQKKTLLGETLSHAAYPGIVLGGWIGYEVFSSFSLLLGGFIFTLLALLAFDFCLRKARISQDAALSFLLSFFWSIGVLALSRLQFVKIALFREVKTFLLGQVATLPSFYFGLSCLFSSLLILGLFFFFRPVQHFLFDSSYSTSSFFFLIKGAFFSFFVFALVLGMRSVGVVLIMGMLVAPPIFARQFTEKLSSLFWIASVMAFFSAFLGNLIPLLYQGGLSNGPLMVWIASFSAIGALFFAPKRGYIYKVLQVLFFRRKCHIENLLKTIYKEEKSSLAEIKEKIALSSPWFFFYIWRLQKRGWMEKRGKALSLTLEGRTKALHIIRLHRLWELYLVSHMNIKPSEVHEKAEYMEHILNEDLEKKLDSALFSPQKDPHDQPIPKR